MNDKELNKLFIEWFYWTIECIGDETNNTKFQRVKDPIGFYNVNFCNVYS